MGIVTQIQVGSEVRDIENHGTLPIAKGGTAITSNPSMLTNLETTTAANVFQASPRPGVTGKLPVANGGTNATTAADARSQLGITPANIGAATSSHNHAASNITSGTLPVARGGTGVTTDASIGLKSYPVGALYISYSSTSPASLFGGTWTQISGCVLRAATSSVDETIRGGDTHTLTTAQTPSHNHYLIDPTDSSKFMIAWKNAGYVSGSSVFQAFGKVEDDKVKTNSVGSGSSHNNLPAYRNFYVWRRTA